MKTKQEQKEEAMEAYEAIVNPINKFYDAIVDPATKAYIAKCKEIDEQEEE